MFEQVGWNMPAKQRNVWSQRPAQSSKRASSRTEVCVPLAMSQEQGDGVMVEFTRFLKSNQHGCLIDK